MLSNILLQIVSPSVTSVSSSPIDTAKIIAAVQSVVPAVPKQDTLSLIDLLWKGGFIMIPMAILSVLTIYFFFERLLTLSKAGKLDKNFMNNIKDYMHSGNVDAAKALCKSTASPAARMIEKGISRLGKPIKEIEEAMESVGKLEINRMEKNLSVLSLIGRIGPIFGFIGTIAGVIKIFYDISLTDNISIGVISAGLYQKMITSATGLVIGLLAFISYYILNAMLDKTINKMETSSVQFLDILNEPGK
jgi:biopolymer transport protein ExbB